MKTNGLILVGQAFDAPPVIEAFCPQCQETVGRVPASGKNRHVDTCRSCGLEHFGGAPETPVGRACARCNGVSLARRRMQPVERIPANEPCGSCRRFNKELARLAKEQNAIGVICQACRAQLIMDGTAGFARAVRARLPAQHGKAVVVTIEQHQCPYCGPEAVAGGCRYRLGGDLGGEYCNQPAEWTVVWGGKHRMPLCDVHVRKYQVDPDQTGPERLGRERDGSRYVIAPVTKGGDQAEKNGG